MILVLISQVLSLAVVSTALWEFRNGLNDVTGGINTSISQAAPDTLTGFSTGDPDRQRPTLRPQKVRMIGEANQIVECISNALLARRLASIQEAGSVKAVEPHVDCNRPEPNKQLGKEDEPPGVK